MEKRELCNVSDSQAVILFDGVCNLCNGFVLFVIKRDKAAYFKFAPLQSDKGQELLRGYVPQRVGEVGTVVLIENGRVFYRSGAALRIARRLGGLWPLFYVFGIVPRVIRDWVYNIIAANRYKWFGRLDECPVPTPDVAKRFIG